MAEDVATVVLCEKCGERTAEVVVDEKRAICGECFVQEQIHPTVRQDGSDTDE